MSVVIRYMHTGSSNRLQGYYAPLGGLPSGASFHLNIGGKVSPGTQPKDAGRVGVDKGVGRSRENFKNLYPNFICILEYFYYKEGFNLSHLASTGLALWRNYLPPHTTHRWGQLLPTLLTQMTLLLAVTKLIYLQPIRRPTVHYSQTVVIETQFEIYNFGEWLASSSLFTMLSCSSTRSVRYIVFWSMSCHQDHDSLACALFDPCVSWRRIYPKLCDNRRVQWLNRVCRTIC